MTTIQSPNAIFILETPNFVSWVSSLLTSKINIVWGWLCQILGRDKWKNRAKAGIMFGFPGFLVQFVPEWWEHPITPFWFKIPPSSLKIEPETFERCFWTDFNNSFNFEPLPSLIYGLNLKCYYAPLRAFNWSLASQNFVAKSYLCQKLWRKNLWSGRVKVQKSLKSWEHLHQMELNVKPMFSPNAYQQFKGALTTLFME